MVDWELCTLGDPLADVGLLLVYWGEEGDELLPLLEPATIAPGVPDARRGASALYAERSGRDLSEIDYYVALGLWKLSIILEGVFARYRAGQYGEAEGPARGRRRAAWSGPLRRGRPAPASRLGRPALTAQAVDAPPAPGVAARGRGSARPRRPSG